MFRTIRLPPRSRRKGISRKFANACRTACRLSLATHRRKNPPPPAPEILPPNAGTGRRALFVVLFTVLFQTLLAAFYLAVRAVIGAG